MSVIRSQCEDNIEFQAALRDEFAAKALIGIIASIPWDSNIVPIACANEAYELADAMIKARKKI